MYFETSITLQNIIYYETERIYIHVYKNENKYPHGSNSSIYYNEGGLVTPKPVTLDWTDCESHSKKIK